MPASTSETVTVTLAEIARIAGVGRAAVSNWRRRHESFPDSVGGTDVSPQFRLSDVQEWLRVQGKLRDQGGDLETLWPRFDALGDKDSSGTAVAALGLVVGSASRNAAPLSSLSQGQRTAVEAALEAARAHGGPRTFTFLMERWLGTYVRQVSTTPAPLASLMADLATPAGARRRSVLDPACGSGSLLLAAAEKWGRGNRRLRLLGQERDGVLAALATARFAAAGLPKAVTSEIQTGDTLRADVWADETVDLVLCNPPYNEREWGHEELATDTRWTLGHPPRTESELAWVQHILARLAPGGSAAVLLPPGVAKRRAGRRIRAGLLRTGALRAVVSLPPGAAPPHSVALQVWLLSKQREARTAQTLLFVDASGQYSRPGGGPPDAVPQGGKASIDWGTLHGSLLEVVRTYEADTEPAADSANPSAPGPVQAKAVSVIDLLDEHVDLTPARHVPAGRSLASHQLRRRWQDFTTALRETGDLADTLASISTVNDAAPSSSTTVDELVRADALELRTGQLPPEGGATDDGAGVPILLVSDVLRGASPSAWLSEEAVAAAGYSVTVTRPGDIVVVGSTRAFDAWVESGSSVLGPQMYALRADTTVLDPWFVAGCLRSPANGRQAGSHATTSSRVNIRRLRVRLMPRAEQDAYATAFRQLATFEQATQNVGRLGQELSGRLVDVVAASVLPQT